MPLLDGGTAKIINKQTESKKEYPPYLFNLSNLQGYITSKYKGWTSDKVLKVAQSLYEKKLTTSPIWGVPSGNAAEHIAGVIEDAVAYVTCFVKYAIPLNPVLPLVPFVPLVPAVPAFAFDQLYVLYI